MKEPLEACPQHFRETETAFQKQIAEDKVGKKGRNNSCPGNTESRNDSV